ncbi:MAG: efflux RND transporter periplasmic adaptor subunit [Terriglobia bacterium]
MHLRRRRCLRKNHSKGNPELPQLLLAGVLFGTALALPACSSKEVAQPEPVVAVQVATVEQKTIQQVITASALLYPLDQATIVPKITAPIKKFYVSRGSHVHAGELLAVLENKDLSAAVVENQGAYDQAQATYVTSTKVSLPAALQTAQLNVQATKQAMQADELVYKSRQKLYQSGAIARNLLDASHVTYVQARNQYQIALANLKALQAVGKQQQLKSAEGQLTSAEGRLLAAQAQYHYSEIRSPIDGVVTDRPLYEGEMASAGTPLITVMNLSHVVAREHISPAEAAQLLVGDPATILQGAGQPPAPGKVSVVSPALDPNSTTVQVWVDAPNPDRRLKAGATVQVKAVARTVNDAMVIPASAVLTASDGSTSVMVVGSDSRAHQTSVKTGIREGGQVQIVSGLEAGERVVTEGAYGLPDGTKVTY